MCGSHKWTLETYLSEKNTVLWSGDNLERTYINVYLSILNYLELLSWVATSPAYISVF